MKRTSIIAIGAAAAVVIVLLVPSIKVDLFCGVKDDPTGPGYAISRGISVAQYLVYLSSGKQLTTENGVTCHEYRG